MGDFTSAASVEMICYQMRLADWTPSQNRALINELADGWPPYSEEEAIQNNVTYNSNDLSLSKVAHDARSQLYNALLTPDPPLTVEVDYGPIYMKREWGEKITNKLGSIIKKSSRYREIMRSTVAQCILHGNGPCVWDDKYQWVPPSVGIEDVMVPQGILLTFDDLPFYAVYRSYSAKKIQSLIRGPNVDPGWKIPVAEQAIEWVKQKASQLFASSWPQVWSPEKMQQQTKECSGLLAMTRVPTIDCWDFRYWSDEGKIHGWRRRIVLDAWGEPGVGGVAGFDPSQKPREPGDRRFDFSKDQFLFDSGDRVYSRNLSDQISFQFADCSAVGPFRYHSVRGLGWLLYNLCHLQNRLKCSLTEAAAEALLQYFRVHNVEDAERAIKVNLINRGIIPDGVDFIPPNQRWVVNQAIVELVLQQNRQTLADNSASFVQDNDTATGGPEETATRTMAKVNASAALVGGMIQQAYSYWELQLNEIARRFCIKNSRDAEVRQFRRDCLTDGVPEEALVFNRWNVRVEKIFGSGNKTLQGAIADKLWEMRPVLDPAAQKKVDRIKIQAFSSDPNLAKDLVPDGPVVSDSVHDAQQSFGTLMQGIQITPKPGLNPIEIIETLLAALAMKIQQCEQNGNMASAPDIQGFQTVAQYIGGYIQMLAQDQSQKQRVKVYGDDLGKLMNVVKGFAQRLQEQQQQAAQSGNGQMDPEAMAKIQADQMAAQSKIQLGQQSHAAKTAQRQISWENEEQRKQDQHRVDLQRQQAELNADLVDKGIQTATDVHKIGLEAKAKAEAEKESKAKEKE